MIRTALAIITVAITATGSVAVIAQASLPDWQEYPLIAACIGALLVVWKSLSNERAARIADKDGTLAARDKTIAELNAKLDGKDAELSVAREKLLEASRDG